MRLARSQVDVNWADGEQELEYCKVKVWGRSMPGTGRRLKKAKTSSSSDFGVEKDLVGMF